MLTSIRYQQCVTSSIFQKVRITIKLICRVNVAHKAEEADLSKEIERIFKESRNNYGTRKIKKELAKLPEPKQVSRRRIGRIMNELGLVSNYTVAQFKPHKSSV